MLDLTGFARICELGGKTRRDPETLVELAQDGRPGKRGQPIFAALDHEGHRQKLGRSRVWWESPVGCRCWLAWRLF